jgi:hypothetical protein
VFSISSLFVSLVTDITIRCRYVIAAEPHWVDGTSLVFEKETDDVTGDVVFTVKVRFCVCSGVFLVVWNDIDSVF